MLTHPVIGVGTFRATPRAKELVLQALENNRLSYGPMMQRFEAEFAKLHGCRFGVMSNSGTSALHVALMALKDLHGWQDGDEVIVPAVTFVSTANIVLHNTMQPVFVDVEPTYYELDPVLIEQKITPRTRAIIPVHLFGHPADMDPIRELASRYHLKIIEDSAETMFAHYKGQSVGSLGDIGCFSTYVAHLLVTGVGGLNTTHEGEYAIKLRSLINHGRDSIYLSIDDDDAKTSEELRVLVARRFAFVSLGHSFRATEMEAALGLAQLEDWEAIIAARRSNAQWLTRVLSLYADRVQLPGIRPGCEHSFMMYPLVLRDQPKAELVNYLEEHGVETRDMLPLINQPVYQRLLGVHETDYPVAAWINRSGFYIGCHQDLSQSDLDYIAELFARFWKPRVVSAHRERALLVMIIRTGSRQNLEHQLEQIPRELFDDVMALVEEDVDGVAPLLTAQQISVFPLNGQDPIRFVCAHGAALTCDHLVFYTADGRHDARDIAKLLFALERGHEMAVASRFLPGGRRHDREHRFHYRSLGNRLFTVAANLLFYGNCTDALSWFRAMKRTALETVQLTTTGYSLLYQLSIQAMKAGWHIAEIPTQEQVDPVIDSRRQAWQSVLPLCRVLLREWMERRTGSRTPTERSPSP